MKQKRYGTDEVIRNLRHSGAMEDAGASRAEVLQNLEVSEQTLLALAQALIVALAAELEEPT